MGIVNVATVGTLLQALNRLSRARHDLQQLVLNK